MFVDKNCEPQCNLKVLPWDSLCLLNL